MDAIEPIDAHPEDVASSMLVVRGPSGCFYDIADVLYGEVFMKTIKASIRACGVLLVVIGKDWNRARLDDLNGPVRTEIEMASKAAVKVIPVMVGPERRDPMPRSMVCRTGLAGHPQLCSGLLGEGLQQPLGRVNRAD